MSDRFRPFRFSRAGLRGLRVSATLSLNERVREMWDAGRDIYHLGFGESRFPVHPKVAKALQANVHRRSYLPALGIRELRETIAQFYQRKFEMAVSPDQVVIGPGSKSLLYALLLGNVEFEVLYGTNYHRRVNPVEFAAYNGSASKPEGGSFWYRRV